MTIRLALAFTLALSLSLFLVGCSVTHRSGEFACGEPGDTCTGGRICQDGFCIVPGATDDGGVDGHGSGSGSDVNPDAGMGSGSDCPAQCTSCNEAKHTCTIDCQVAGSAVCSKAITCPPGFNCDVLCSTQNACRGGVACPENGSCNVQCTGQASCQNVSCGDGPCDVQCIGSESCRTIGCNSSCACDVTCSDTSRCQGVTCTAFECETISTTNGDTECSSSQNPDCNTCP